MATVIGNFLWTQSGVSVATWAGLSEGDDTGSAFDSADLPDKCVHIKGNFGVGGNVLMEGSNDGVTWLTLTDPQGNPLSKAAESLEQIQENPRYVRPRVSAGTGVLGMVIMVSRGDS